MLIYITNGTYEFLKGIKKRYPQEDMVIMENENGALLIHETSGDSVFKEPRKYEIVDEAGHFGESGFVVLNNIPVTDEGRPIFEYRFKDRSKQIENEPGFLAIKVLRPLSSNTYIIMTAWENETAFQNWKKSSSFMEAHSSKKMDNGGDPKVKIFASTSYVTKYTLSD